MINKIKKVSLQDIIGIFKFLLVLIPASIKKIYLKIKNKELWLICETESTARDNGFCFYKFMKENHPEIDCYYAIEKKAPDYKKVQEYGNIIEHASLKHYYYYMSATKNISSHKSGNPNQTLFTILHLYLNLYNNRVFIQHGIILNDLSMFYYENTKFKKFICGARKEYEYIQKNYHYPNNIPVFTGLPRFDSLNDFKKDHQMILYIPTWRRWIDSENALKESIYYKKIISLIQSPKLQEILEKNNKYLYFYPHLSMQKYMNYFTSSNSRVKILDASSIDIQELLKKASLMITDFSSVHFDFAYMKKPIIYYQYDSEEFYKKHVAKGYFDYEKMGFGKIVRNENELLKQLEILIKQNYKNSEEYIDRVKSFFEFNDNNNCERVFNAILKLK